MTCEPLRQTIWRHSRETGRDNTVSGSTGTTVSVLPGLEKMLRMWKSWIIIEKGSDQMTNYIQTPKISEILSEEFMQPLGISSYKLAKDIHVPVSRIQEILHDRRKITADTFVRLGKYFGVSPRYFLNLQDDIDIRNINHSQGKDIDQIKTIQYV